MIPNFNNNDTCFELFNAQIDIIKYWKMKGKISKEFDPHSKSYIYYLYFGGVSRLSTPIDEKRSLQIINPCLLFQFMLYNTKSFSIEINIRDKSESKRRFNITSSVKEVDKNTMHIKIPLIDYPLNIWTNLIIDLNSLTQTYFKSQSFKTIESIHITGNLKIRKIFSLKSKDEPVLKTLDMGKSHPLVNLLFTETGNIITTNIKILGINNNTHINTVHIDSKLIPEKKKASPSPQPNNKSKYSTTSDIAINRHKQIYAKKNNNNKEMNNINNININININNVKNDDIISKNKKNSEFIKMLPDVTRLVNDVKYKKNDKFKKYIKDIKINEERDNSSNFVINNINLNGINNNNNTNTNAMKNNFVEKKKSLGNYMQTQKNKKRNKSNNPFLRPKINKKKENSILKEDKSEKKLNVMNNRSIPKKIENNEKNDKIIKAKQQEKEKKNEIKNININVNKNNYYDSKEKEISFDDFTPDAKGENKFKFNNMPLGDSLIPNKTKKEEPKESQNDTNNNQNTNIQKPNKFSNYNMLLESGIDIKNIPVYDSIEEVAEWPGGDWNNAVQGEGVGDKLIKLDNTKKVEKKDNNINMDDEDLLEFGSLEKKDLYRPYTPPIEELVQVNPSKIKGDSNMKASLDKKNSIKSKGTLKNYENLVYDEEKGLLCDPLTNKYYDIKAK